MFRFGRKPEGSRQHRINVGAGSRGEQGFVNCDLRARPGVQIQCDVRRLPFRPHSIDEIQAIALLEHFSDPYEVLDEFQQVIARDGLVRIDVPALGTYGAHLDLDHRWLADLRLWQDILKGYYATVVTRPLGVKYRANKLLVAVLMVLVYGLRMYDFAHAWSFICTKPRRRPRRTYIAWWLEEKYGKDAQFDGGRVLQQPF